MSFINYQERVEEGKSNVKCEDVAKTILEILSSSISLVYVDIRCIDMHEEYELLFDIDAKENINVLLYEEFVSKLKKQGLFNLDDLSKENSTFWKCTISRK